MVKKQIMLVCAAGMSTSLMVNKMQKSASERAIEADIFAIPVAEADDYLETHQVSVVLLGPQVRYLLKGFEEKLAPSGTPVDVIPMTDYGMMKGDKVLDLANTLIQE
ncbi:MAG: PTS sugar transporter subunit IIB [Streptococcus sp.]|nr:PTS sugar transporter subunit IIB [Streptococcus sp.]